MTVIASFYANGCPILIADTLMSGIFGPRLMLPTSGSIDNILDAQRGEPTTLVRKLVWICPNLIIAFAGDLVPCQTAVASLRREADEAEGLFTLDRWRQFLLQKGPMLNRVSLVGWLIEQEEGEPALHQVAHQASEGVLDVFGPAKVAGSGTLMLADACAWLPQSVTAGVGIIPALRTMASLVSILLREEHATGLGVVQARAGGFYEVAVWNGSQFVMLADVTHVIWHADFRPDRTGKLFGPMLALRQSYDQSQAHLIVESWRVSAEEGPFENDCPRVLELTHLVPHVGVPADQRVIPTTHPDYKSRFTVHCAGIFSEGDQSGLGVAVTLDEDQTFTVIHDASQSRYVLPASARNALWEAVKEAVDEGSVEFSA